MVVMSVVRTQILILCSYIMYLILIVSHKYNEIKYLILRLIYHNARDYTAAELAEAIGISLHNATEQMRRLYQMGYVYRKKEHRKRRRNRYLYGALCQKGKRILKRLEDRVKLQKQTGKEISLNLKRSVFKSKWG
jgi:DNA-binding MarR family transcriptional regulator